VAGLSDGQTVILELGTDPYDPAQPYLVWWDVITDVNGRTITLDRPIPETVTGTSHKIKVVSTEPAGSIVRNLTIANPKARGYAIWVCETRNVFLENVTFPVTYAGIIVSNTEDVSIKNLHVVHHLYSAGRYAGINAYHNYNLTVDGMFIDHVSRAGAFYLESQNRKVDLNNIIVFAPDSQTNDLGQYP
jgi:hypothetical protein